MTIGNRFGLLYLSLSLVLLVSCAGNGFTAAENVTDSGATAEDAIAEPAEDVQEEPDAVAPDAEEEDAAQEPDAQIQDVQPDVEDAKPDGQPISPLCQQNMQGANDVFVIGQAPIGGTVRISIFGYLDFPVDSGLADTTKSGWCWGDFGQATIVCFPQWQGQNLKAIPDMDIYAHPGIAIVDGGPQTAPLCETDICNQTYTFCRGSHQICAVNGSQLAPGTSLVGYTDQTIKCHVPLKP